MKINNRVYAILIFSLLILTFCFSAGCGRYAQQFSPPVVLSRYPVLFQGGVGSGEALWVKFSKSMDTDGFDIAGVVNKIKTASDMTATVTSFASPSPEVTWSESNTKLTFTNFFMIAFPGSRVHIVASRDAFVDVNGQDLSENADLWDYDLAGIDVTFRDPAIGDTLSNGVMTLEAVFNNPVATIEIATGPTHTAGAPAAVNELFTLPSSILTFEVDTWASTGVADITYEAVDVYGNVNSNGQLFLFNVN